MSEDTKKQPFGGPALAKKNSLKPFKIKRDFWDDSETRHPAGSIVDLNPNDDAVLKSLSHGIIELV